MKKKRDYSMLFELNLFRMPRRDAYIGIKINHPRHRYRPATVKNTSEN